MINVEHVVYLSHWIDEDTAVYGNKGGFQRKKISSISNGDSANSEYWEFNNHIGTHIDFPRHFCEKGKTSSDYPASYFRASKIGVIELTSIPNPGYMIGINDIRECGEQLSGDIEVLLLKTGFEHFRKEEIYWSQNPGYQHDLYNYLKKSFPKLRFFGFDTISLTSILNREEGRSAHRHFLCNEDPLLVIEDMHLESIHRDMNALELIISHGMVRQADGGPVNCLLRYTT